MDNLYENDWDSSVPMRPGGLELTEKLLNISGMKSGLVLDFGCGEGHTANYLINKNFDVIGIDKSDLLIKKGIMRYPKVKFIISENIENLNFQNTFDGIISECVIASLENKKEIIRKMYTFLKYNGILIINDITALVKKKGNDFFTFNDWVEILKISGFEIMYYEENTLELRQFYLKTLWEGHENCVLECIPNGYKANETGYFSIIAKKI